MYRLFLISVLLCFSLSIAANPFTDVPEGHWAYAAVKKLCDKKILTGYPDGSFNGTKKVTRYDFAVALSRLMADDCSSECKQGCESDDLRKLAMEFSDELALLGIKVTAVEDKIAQARQETKKLAKEVAILKTTGGKGRIALSGDIRTRFDDVDYENENIEAQYNRNHTMQRFGLNIDAAIDEDVSAKLRFERFGFWNSQAGDWTLNKVTGTRVDTDLRTYMAYVEVKDFFGWADSFKLGRQRFAMGQDLLIKGIADGFTCSKYLGLDRDVVLRTGALKMDDNDSSGLNDNEGLDLSYLNLTFDLKDVLAEIYVMNGRDALSQPYANAAALAAAQAAGYRGLTDATVTSKHVKRNTWYGISLSGNPLKDLHVYGEFAWLNWDESIDADGDGNNEDGDNGYLIGLNWKAHKKTKIKLQYTAFDEWFYRPMDANYGTIWDVDQYLDNPVTFIYDAAGFRSDFKDFLFEIKHDLTDKLLVVGRYETVNDKTSYLPNIQSDDRTFITGLFKYQYKQNTSFILQLRKCSTEENVPTAFGAVANGPGNAAGQAHGTAGDSWGNVQGNTTVNDAAGQNIVVNDLHLVRLQMDVKF